MALSPSQPLEFEGFSSPNATPVPDVLFDYLAPRLSEAELRVLLYIIRRTFGFKKEADAISISQMVDGIRTRRDDGALQVIDAGTGMGRKAVCNGIRGLLDKRVIEVDRRISARGDADANVYRLRFRPGTIPLSSPAAAPSTPRRPKAEGVVSQEHYRGVPRKPRVVSQGNGQHDRSQHDREQQHGRHLHRTKKPDSQPPHPTPVQSPLLTSLLALGFTAQIATNLLTTYPAHTIAAWLEALPHLSNTKDPAAFLVQALKKNWALPPQYLQAQKKSELAKKKRAADDAAASAQVAAEQTRLGRKVKVDAYLAVLDEGERQLLEAEAAARVREEGDGSYWKDRNIPKVLLTSCLRGIVAERMGLPPLDEALTSGEFAAVSPEVAR